MIRLAFRGKIWWTMHRNLFNTQSLDSFQIPERCLRCGWANRNLNAPSQTPYACVQFRNRGLRFFQRKFQTKKHFYELHKTTFRWWIDELNVAIYHVLWSDTSMKHPNAPGAFFYSLCMLNCCRQLLWFMRNTFFQVFLLPERRYNVCKCACLYVHKKSSITDFADESDDIVC